MLMLISNLYEESIHLKKTLQDAENITKKSYDLYKSLDSLENEQMSFPVEDFRRQALIIAGEVHEVKKDNQRIFAGLSKLISDESFTDYMSVHELANIIVRANEKYARLLGKDIQFVYTIDGTHPHYHIYTILSIINNVVANAVEAIKDTGTITIDINKEHNSVEFRIGVNGPGVASKHKALIFKPGFTSRYDLAGNPSTGIGLSYVKEIVEQLEGDVTVQDRPEGKGSIFIIRLLVDHLIEKG
jgi:two-component system sensor histidine kinase YcbA